MGDGEESNSGSAEAGRLNKAGLIRDAHAICAALVAKEPNNVEAIHLLGVLSLQLGQMAVAESLIQHSLSIQPHNARFHANLGSVLGAMGKTNDAIAALSEAVRLNPDYAEAHRNLAVALENAGRLNEAIAACRRVLELRPEYALSHIHLGNVLRQKGWIEEALESHREAVRLAHSNNDAQQQLALSLWQQGDQRAAIESYRTVLALCPTDAAAHSSLAFAMLHDPDCPPADRLKEAQAWDRLHAQPFAQPSNPHHNDRSPSRRLRVGCVSPDFVDHPGTRIFIPVLKSHDRNEMELICYSGGPKADAATDQVRSLAAGWRDIRHMSDDAAAQLIREDRIDVLLDFSGHMGATRLLTFARRPAPVQVHSTCIRVAPD
jgi:protein O-GlcNAc transferase